MNRVICLSLKTRRSSSVLIIQKHKTFIDYTNIKWLPHSFNQSKMLIKYITDIVLRIQKSIKNNSTFKKYKV